MRRTRPTAFRTAANLCVAAVLVFSACATPAHAAWTRKQGTWFTAQNINVYRTNQFITHDGKRRREAPFRKQEWNSYAEYGWRDDTTLGFNLFAQRLSVDKRGYDPAKGHAVQYTEDNYALGDTEFFLRQKIWGGDILGQDMHFALQPLLKLPSLYLDGNTPRSGTDAVDVELRLQTGSGFSLFSRQHFVAFDIAYRKRNGGWRNQWKSDSTLGLGLTTRWMALVQFHTTRTVGGIRTPASSSATVNDYDLHKLQASLVYRLSDATRLQLGGFRHLRARNTGEGDGVLFSIWREF